MDTRLQFIHPLSVYRHFISPPQAKNLNIKDRSILITGGNAGIGKYAVLEMARQGAKEVTICARTAKTANDVIQLCKEEQAKNGINPTLFKFVQLDLGDQAQIKQTVETQLNQPYDVIIGNSGVLAKELKRTADGFESCFGVNHLGHYTFILHYLNTTKHRPDTINLTSSTAHLDAGKSIRFSDPNFEREGSFKSLPAYAQSKLANVLFARKLAEKMPDVRVNHVHPGVVSTELFDRLMAGSRIFKFLMNTFMRKPVDGAQSTLYAAFSNDIPATETGVYYANCENAEHYLSPTGKSKEQADKLWELSKDLTGVDLEI